jgi:hypothetical protein
MAPKCRVTIFGSLQRGRNEGYPWDGFLTLRRPALFTSTATAHGARFPGRLFLHNHGLSRSSAPFYSRLVPSNTSTVVKLLPLKWPQSLRPYYRSCSLASRELLPTTPIFSGPTSLFSTVLIPVANVNRLRSAPETILQECGIAACLETRTKFVTQ